MCPPMPPEYVLALLDGIINLDLLIYIRYIRLLFLQVPKLFSQNGGGKHGDESHSQ